MIMVYMNVNVLLDTLVMDLNAMILTSVSWGFITVPFKAIASITTGVIFVNAMLDIKKLLVLITSVKKDRVSVAALIWTNAFHVPTPVLNFTFAITLLAVIPVIVKPDIRVMVINAKMLTSVEVISKVTQLTAMQMLSVLIPLVPIDVNVKMDIPVMVQHVQIQMSVWMDITIVTRMLIASIAMVILYVNVVKVTLVMVLLVLMLIVVLKMRTIVMHGQHASILLVHISVFAMKDSPVPEMKPMVLFKMSVVVGILMNVLLVYIIVLNIKSVLIILEVMVATVKTAGYMLVVNVLTETNVPQEDTYAIYTPFV